MWCWRYGYNVSAMNNNNIISKTEARRNWDRARHAASLEALVSVFTQRSIDLLSFEQVKDQLHLAERNYKGIREIEIASIRGSVGRYKDFTNTFLPRRAKMEQRWLRIDILAYETGLSPIDVYKVGGAYFVLDGNHRVSVARQSDAKTILAHVWEYVTPVGLSSEADLDEVLLKAEYTDFLDYTKLAPPIYGEEIIFTAPGRYREMEYQIALYRQSLELIDEHPVSLEYAAQLWYEMVYSPAIQIIAEQGLIEQFPNRTAADLFIWVWRHRRELEKRHSVSFVQAAQDVMHERWYKRLWYSLVQGASRK